MAEMANVIELNMKPGVNPTRPIRIPPQRAPNNSRYRLSPCKNPLPSVKFSFFTSESSKADEAGSKTAPKIEIITTAPKMAMELNPIMMTMAARMAIAQARTRSDIIMSFLLS